MHDVNWPQTVQPSEIVWSALAAVALAQSLASLGDAIATDGALRASGRNGATRALARLIIIMECSRGVMALVALVVGLLMMAEPYGGTLAAAYVHGGMIAICLVLLGATAYSRHVRARIVHHLERRDDHG